MIDINRNKIFILIFFILTYINIIKSDILIKYYEEPLPENFVADPMGNCKVKYSLFIKSDVPIKSIETSPSATNPFGELNKLNITFSFEIISNLASPNFTLTVIVIDNNLKEFRDYRMVYCVKLNNYGPTTKYLLQTKQNKLFLNGLISNSSKTGKISGPLIVVEYIGNTPPLLKSLYPSGFNLLIKLLGNKKTSKLYEILFFTPTINYFFDQFQIDYEGGSLIIDQLPSATNIPIIYTPLSIFPSKDQPSPSVVGFFNFKFHDDSQERAIRISSENSYVYPAFNDGLNITYLCYFNEKGKSDISVSFGIQTNSIFLDTINIQAEDYSQGKEMSLLFNDPLMDTTPTAFTVVLSGVPLLPQYPIKLTYPSGLKRQLWLNQNPFSLKNGFRKDSTDTYEIVFTAKLSKYSSGQYILNFNSTNGLTFDVTPKPELMVDNRPPEIIMVESFNIGRMKIDIQISIIDDISGFSAFMCLDTNEIIFDYKNLKKGGTINNGVYSFIYDYGFTPVCKKSAFLDFAGNILVQKIPFLDLIVSNGEFSYFSIDLPITKPKTLSDFDQFYFAFNNIDLTNRGFYNTLFFNFKDNDNDPDYCIKFRLAISEGWPNPVDSYSKWDNNLQMYRVDFFLPSNLLNMDILYYIYLGLDYETQYSTSHFQSWISSNNATLSVYSNIGDIMPPMVQYLDWLLTDRLNTSIQRNLTWILTIEDQYNGFDMGELTIMGSVDFIPWNFKFSSNNKNSLSDYYSFTIHIPPNSRSQIYYITHLKLVDKNGIFSEYNFSKPQAFPIIDPLVKILNKAFRVLGDDDNPFSSTLPTLVDFITTSNSIDVGGSDLSRTVTFTIKTKDVVGIRQDVKPIIYLGDTYLNYIPVPVISDGVFNPITSVTTFTVSTIIPYGFGYPEGILLNVYGIKSSHSTFQGYSSFDLHSQSFIYSIKTPTFSVGTKLLSYSPISNKGGQLTIFGRSLDAIKNPSYYITLTTQPNGSNTIPNIPFISISSSAVIITAVPSNSSFSVFLIDLSSNGIVDSITIYPYYDYWNSTSNPITPSVTPSGTPSGTPSQTPTETPTVPPTNAPQNCGGNPQCGGESKGKCVDGVGCVCISPWIGNECQSRIIIIPPPVIDPTNPNQNLTLNSTGTNEFTLVSLVSLVSLRELNFKNELVRTFRFDKWKLISNTTTNSNYITDIIDPKNNNTICSVNVSTIWYETIAEIQFAGQNLTMNPSTLKYNINITSFPFTNGLNTLQLVMSATAQSTSSQDDQCSSNEFGDTTSNDNSNYLQLSVNQHSLYGRFIKRGIVDNTIRSIGNEILKDLSSENSYYISQSYIGINIPFYKEFIQLDPDFSVLLDQRSASSICNNKGNKLSKGAIIGISIGCAAFTIIVVALFFIFLKNKYFFKSVELNYYEEPLPENFVADSIGYCKVKYSLFIKSDVPIKSIETSPSATNPFGELNKLNSTFSFEIVSNLASPNFTLTVIVIDNNLKEFRYYRMVYCVKLNNYGPITKYLLQTKENKLFLNGLICKSSKTGKISGPLIVVEYIGNTPPLLKSLSNHEVLNSSIRLLGNKKTSKLYEILFFTPMPNYFFDQLQMDYEWGSFIIEQLPSRNIQSFFAPFSIFPNDKPSASAVGFLSYKFNDASQERAIRISSENSYVYPAFNDGLNITYICYFNENGKSNISVSFGTQSFPIFSKIFDIHDEDYSQGKAMSLLFNDPLMDTTPTAFTVVLGGVPLLPQYPIKLTYPSGLKRQLWLNQNPFSLKNGFRKDSTDTYEIVFTAKLSKYSSGQYILNFNSTNGLAFDVTPKPELMVDNRPPEIIMVESFNIGRMKIDIQISIIDDISGFSAFMCLDTNEIIFDYKNLKKGGTINNGVYSFIYDYGFTPVCKKSAFLDFAGNILVQNIPFLDLIVSNGEFNYFSIDLPITKPKTLSDFDQFYFAFNNIDLTNRGFYNTLFFNFKDNDNDPDYCIKFRLAISEGWPNPVDSYSTWDNNLQMYRVDFFLPSNLLNMDILYYIYLGLDYETQYSTSHFQSWISSNNATLSVYSNIGDIMPPMVQYLDWQINDSSNPSIQRNLIWVFNIGDQYNGFDMGELTIMGSVDFIPWNFKFSSNNKNPLSDYYNFTIPIPPYSRTQTYYITHLKLVDKNGIFSEYNFSKPQVFPIIDPLIKMSLRSYQVRGDDDNPFSSTLPVLVDFTIKPSLIDVGGSDLSRNVTFTIKTKDEVGIRQEVKPIIYLGDTYLNYIPVPVISDGVFDLITSVTTFTVSTIIPYGFGYPEGILLNVYGIKSSHSTFQGFSSFDLRDASFNYSINTSTFTVGTKLLSYSPISNKGGQLTIFGRSLDAIKNPSYLITLTSQTNSSTLIPNIPFISISSSAVIITAVPSNFSFSVFLIDSSSDSIIDSITIYPYYDHWESNPIKPTVPPIVLPTNAPQNCGGNPQCGGESKGKCVDGVGCVCISPWIGNECQSRIIIIPPPVIDPTNPNQNLTLNSTGTNEFTLVSLVSLVSLRELNFKNELVRTFRFDKWKLISNTTTNSNYITDIIDPKNNNTICSVNVSTIWYETIAEIQFAGQNLTMNPSTLKYNINITSFPFTNGLNTLQLVMSATAQSTSSQDDQCSSNEFGDTTSNDNSNYLQLSVNQHSLYGRFIKRGIVDNTIRSIGNEILKDLSSENSYYISQSYIGINIPFYKEFIQLDPDFSVLLDQRSASSICNNKGNKLSKGAIIGIVIGSVAFIVIAITLLAILLKNKYFFKRIQLKAIELVDTKNK
ncbi:hypothetical protein ACTFIZ_003662 [Dictyostelium cf. discoideum]